MTEAQLNSVIESKNLNIESLTQLVFELQEEVQLQKSYVNLYKEKSKHYSKTAAYEMKMKNAYKKSYREADMKNN
mgnify:CR=1 FL=1